MDESRLREAPATATAANAQVFTVTPITAQLVAMQNAQLAQATAPVSNAALAEQVANYKYHIGPEDILSISIYNHPELASTVAAGQTLDQSGIVVNQAGDISYPFAGTLHVAGQTVSDVRNELTRRLAEYLKNPQVQVRVASFRSQQVNVTGEVKRPGVLPITDTPLTAVDAINKAEGGTPDANMQSVTLTRNGVTKKLDLQNLDERGDQSQNILLRNGDVLNVADRGGNKVIVMGEVGRQSALQMNKGRMNLAEALGSAEGLDRTTANARRIYVIRGNINRPTIYKLDGNAPDAMLLASQFQLKPRDIVYVSASEVSNWGRQLGQILPSLTSVLLLRGL